MAQTQRNALNDVIMVALIYWVPPLAVYAHEGSRQEDVIVSTVIFFTVGVIPFVVMLLNYSTVYLSHPLLLTFLYYASLVILPFPGFCHALYCVYQQQPLTYANASLSLTGLELSRNNKTLTLKTVNEMTAKEETHSKVEKEEDDESESRLPNALETVQQNPAVTQFPTTIGRDDEGSEMPSDADETTKKKFGDKKAKAKPQKKSGDKKANAKPQKKSGNKNAKEAKPQKKSGGKKAKEAKPEKKSGGKKAKEAKPQKKSGGKKIKEVKPSPVPSAGTSSPAKVEASSAKNHFPQLAATKSKVQSPQAVSPFTSLKSPFPFMAVKALVGNAATPRKSPAM